MKNPETPLVTGGGGIGAYHFAGPRKSETLDIMQKKYPNWFSPHLHQFWGSARNCHWFPACIHGGGLERDDGFLR